MSSGDTAASNLDSSGNEVATHYNSKKEGDLIERTNSRIYHLRNFNNWIKSVIVKEYVTKIRNDVGRYDYKPRVLDLGCGRGGDIKKWLRSNVKHVLFTDLAALSLEECKKRYNEECKKRNYIFNADFVELDASRELLSSKFQLEETVDLISCQFVLHYAFESYAQADTFMKNVSDSLKTGGYFIGTTTNAYEIVKRLRESKTNSFGNDVFRLTYTGAGNKNDEIPLFGAKLDFQLEGVVDCPEYLLYFPLLVKLAEKYKLELVEKLTFDEMFEKFVKKPEYESLLTQMDALEVYNEENSILKGSQESEYEHVKMKLDEFKTDPPSNNKSNDDKLQLGTLSKAEWDVATLYIVYAFVKVE